MSLLKYADPTKDTFAYESNNPKIEFKSSLCEPLINFGIYYPYKSAPFLKAFKPKNLIHDLAKIAQISLLKAKYVKSKKHLVLPGIIKIYEEDIFGSTKNKNFLILLKEAVFGDVSPKLDAKVIPR